MSIIRKNNRASRFSTFREEKASFLPDSTPQRERTQISVSKSQQQYDTFSNLENTNDQGVPPSRKLQVKFFTFLNDFSRKISTIKEYNASNTEAETQNDVSIQFEQKTQENPIYKMQLSENAQLSQKRRSRHSRAKSFRDSIEIIQANLKDGKFHGLAKLILKNGGIFTGETQAGELKKGKVAYQSGLQYDGYFQNNVFHGLSDIKLKNGTKMKIKWFHGIPEPKGEIFYTNGEYYIGGIKDFKKDGVGQLYLRTGKKYVGEFEKGEICGKGIFYDKDQKIIAEGMWYNGKFIGNTILTPSLRTYSSSSGSSKT